MISTPAIIVFVLLALVAAWKFDVIGRLRGHPGRPVAAPILGPTAVPGPVPPELLKYDSDILGLAFHLAVRREADAQVARSMADQGRAAAVAAYTSPFSAGGPAAPPPAPQPGASPGIR